MWVFAGEIPEGTWGGGGQIVGLADIATFVLSDREAGAAHARAQLRARKVECDALYA